MTNRKSLIRQPIVRKLRVFAVDSGLTERFSTAVKNEMTIAIPWEEVALGPAGEYVHVVDIDQDGKQQNAPVDLNDPLILAQGGLAPSDGDPQFRQQMVYAVAMRTIRGFERALGRVVHWAPEGSSLQGFGARGRYRRQLKIHPNFFREANAYHSIEDGALIFGYFQINAEASFDGTVAFSSLSQDVIAREVTLAIMFGMGLVFQGATPDEFAFYEAFADLVALLQHFWMSPVLVAQLAEIRGRLDERSPLGSVALQLGQAMGRIDGLRNVFGETIDGHWRPRRPDPKLYTSRTESHDRGDVLVTAIFSVFRKIYESRVADLRRIATKGSGILPEGDIHPDLAKRFAFEAAKSARHLLDICVRALDYLPSANLTFGDFLRAILTSDSELYPHDEWNYRLAFVDAFRSYGIVPSDVKTVSVDTLTWPLVTEPYSARALQEFVRDLTQEYGEWSLLHDRERLWIGLESWKKKLHATLTKNPTRWPKEWQIDFRESFVVLSLVPRQRSDAYGNISFQWIMKITQQLSQREPQSKPDDSGSDSSPPPKVGLTLTAEARTGLVQYSIVKRPTDQQAELESFPDIGFCSLTTRRSLRERKLRVFAFDPSAGIQLETAGINEVTLQVPWERDGSGADLLLPGPIGEYLEVIDRDPASGCFYEPIDLNHRFVLAQDGLTPSESNPQFHQQMVYAVAMRTIRRFEMALGRLALWAPRSSISTTKKKRPAEEYVARLRIYPHALREANAYYSPRKVALLFGYFPAPTPGVNVDTTRVNIFTCLSHDIIAHEVTHALLDGMHRRFAEPSNPDVLAFHEAFADIVALFQHFSLPGVLGHQIAMTRGDLASQNRLGELAQQFGLAIGKRGALRSALGHSDEATGKWTPRIPNPDDYDRAREPHERGAILVAAVFDAFLTTYKSRIADLLRIASEGTGVLPEGQLSPDLVNRLAEEASRAAAQILEMCIRALDYCPPVDLTFGDYLRAIITADFEFDPIQGEHPRIAVAEAFRRFGIVPEGVRTLSVDGLLWRPTSAAPDENEDVLLSIFSKWGTMIDLWSLSNDRRQVFEQTARQRAALQKYLGNKFSKEGATLSGVDPTLPFEVHSIRPCVRMDWEGRPSFQWIVEITQHVPQHFDSADAERSDVKPDYFARGGCTLVVDATTGKIRYTIRKTLDRTRMDRQKRFVLEHTSESLAATYFGAGEESEPFAMLHRH
jgi:hypothetical protein